MVAAGDPACPVHNIKKGEYIMDKTTFNIFPKEVSHF